MKKKILATLLAAAMMLTVTACNNEKPKEDKPAEPAQEAEQSPEESEEALAEEEAVEEAAPLVPIICTKDYNMYDEEIEKQTFSGRREGVILDDSCKEDYPKLYETLNASWEKNLKEGNKSAEEMASEARSQYDEMVSYGSDADYFSGYSDESSVYVQRADGKVLSFSEDNSTYTGGAHGMYGTVGYTYDCESGEVLKLSDVITDLEAYGKKLYERVMEDYSDVIFEDSEGTLESTIIDEVKGDTICWDLDPDGITYYFNPYDIAAYAAGKQTVKITYKEAPELFNEKYLPKEDAAYAVSGERNFWFDTDGDGRVESVTIDGKYPEYTEDMSSYEAEGIVIMIGGKEVAAIGDGSVIFDWHGYHVHTAEGDDYLLISTLMENDWHTLTVCRLEDGGVKELDSYNMSVTYITYDDENEVSKSYAVTNPDKLPLSEHFDRLGTYSAGCMYTLTSEGKLKPLDKYAYLPESVSKYMVITSKTDITADIVDEEGQVKEEGVTIPSGSEYHIFRTTYDEVEKDGYYVDCKLKDDRIVRLLFVTKRGDDVWENLVNGINEWDAFETVLYAG